MMRNSRYYLQNREGRFSKGMSEEKAEVSVRENEHFVFRITLGFWLRVKHAASRFHHGQQYVYLDTILEHWHVLSLQQIIFFNKPFSNVFYMPSNVLGGREHVSLCLQHFQRLMVKVHLIRL